jgi:acid phosphatase (class A)
MHRLTVRVLVLVCAGVLSCPAADTYLPPMAIDVAALLPPPVPLGTREELAEMDVVLALQQHRSDIDIARIHAEDQMSLSCFVDAIGTWCQPERLPRLSALILAIHAECRPLVHAGKSHFAHPRPPAVDSRVTPIVTEGEGSYPSGHSTRAMADALILAELIPEARQSLIARAQEIGFDRVMGGVHFPSDIQAGRTLGQAIAHALLGTPSFTSELAAVRTEIASARKAPVTP